MKPRWLAVGLILVPKGTRISPFSFSESNAKKRHTRYFTSTYAGSFTGRFNELEYGVFYRLGARDLAVYYSSTSRRLQFDVVGARF